jgi:catechol 2,3-dioxygenase-like lactoylglutathione lyase family enzyme
VKVHGVSWLGTRTERYDPMVAFLRDVLELEVAHEEPGFAVFRCPNDDLVEVFAPGHEHAQEFFTTGPVAGFRVDDVDTAKAELEAGGIEFLGERGSTEDGHAWWHFRAPDGNVYEITSGPPAGGA